MPSNSIQPVGKPKKLEMQQNSTQPVGSPKPVGMNRTLPVGAPKPIQKVKGLGSAAQKVARTLPAKAKKPNLRKAAGRMMGKLPNAGSY